MRTLFYVKCLTYKITHLTMKITVIPEYGDEKRHYTLALLQNKLTASSGIVLTSNSYASDC